MTSAEHSRLDSCEATDFIASTSDFRKIVERTKQSRHDRDKQFLTEHGIFSPIKDDFDFSLSTERNYARADAPFVGKYSKERSELDYEYHRRYCEARQHLHDQIIDHFLNTRVVDCRTHGVCESPVDNWIVFTAGPMGAGKGHTLQWLAREGLFPLEAFVRVDPDEIRKYLPETVEYNQRDDNCTGYLTQKEVGYISEVLTLDALNKNRNVLVDGSLRNATWYIKYFEGLRKSFPRLRISILNVRAELSTVLKRAKHRALFTGRIVPEEAILDSIDAISHSLEALVPKADFYARIDNEDDDDPIVEYCEMKAKNLTRISWVLAKENHEFTLKDLDYDETRKCFDWKEAFRDVWVMHCPQIPA